MIGLLNNKKMKLVVLALIQLTTLVCLIFIIVGKLNANRVYTASFDTVAKAALEPADKDMMQEADTTLLKRFYGFDPSNFDTIKLWAPKSNMACEELLVVKLHSISDQKSVLDAINKRNKEQLKAFDGYGTYQHGMLKRAIIEVRGNYILYIVSKNPNATKMAFDKALRS